MTLKQALVPSILAVLGSVTWTQEATALTLDGPPSCGEVEGAWVREDRPYIGRCELRAGLLIDTGDKLDIAAGVILTLLNSTLTNDGGALFVAANAALHIAGGALVNRGTMDIDDDGTLDLERGYLDNRWLLQSEGTIAVGSGTTFYNSGTLRNFSGGTVENDGTIILYREGDRCEINNEVGGTINNRYEIYIVEPCALANQGEINNMSLGFLRIHGTLHNSPGLVNNAGWIDSQSGDFLNQDGTIVNESGGWIWNTGTALLDNYGAGTLTNQSNGFIQNSAPSRITNRGSGIVNNAAGGYILNDEGSFSNSAVIENSGRLENDATTGGSVGTFTNGGGATIENNVSGEIHNTAGIFTNDAGATINNNGLFRNCFGRYRDNGTFNGNAVEFCVDPWPF